MSILIAGKSPVTIEEFPASGTWTKPATGTIASVECFGGGGGGGREYNGSNPGALGGGGGGYLRIISPLSELPDTVSITIGAGGAGRSTYGNGSAGGDTSFGSFVAGGGKGGNGNYIAMPAYAAGGGGSTAGGNSGANGGTGGGASKSPAAASGVGALGGNGGALNAAGDYPGGGGGASTTVSGAGADGFVRVTIW